MPKLISLAQLAVGFIPVAAVLVILFRWNAAYRTGILAFVRMLIQLLLIGYVLTAIFAIDQAWLVLAILLLMIAIASWIALRSIAAQRRRLFIYAFLSILIGGGSVAAIVTLGVLQLEPWYLPRYVIPLAGMIFANSMNAVSLAAERYFAELDRQADEKASRRVALEAALIPSTNALFAVGLVSIPGMMAGQVLAGVEPAVAARYQIMVMCMIYGSAGLSAACFLQFMESASQIQRHDEQLQDEDHS